MDPKLVIGFIFSHYVLIFGTTLALFFTVCMVLLIRSIGQKSEEVAPIDVNAIEGVMKRVLASQPITVAKISAPSSEAVAMPIPSEEGGDQSALVAERDATIDSLKKEIDALKAATPASGGDAVDTSPFTSEIAGLNTKVDELQARLAEYEIIEDDIADLSMFKEKNRTLETEVAELKRKLMEATTAAAAAAIAPAAASAAPAAAAAPAATNGSLTPSLDSGIKFEAVDKFELDLNNDAMKEFTAAIEGNNAAIAAVKDLPPKAEEPAAEASSSTGLDSQAEIDALLKAHSAETAPAPAPEETKAPVDPQAEIDALMKAHGGGGETPALAVAPVAVAEPVQASVDSQSDIDALMKAHSPAAPAPAAAAPVAAEAVVPAPAPAAQSMVIEKEHEPVKLTVAHEPGLDDLLMGDALAPEPVLDIDDPLAGITDAEKMLSEVESIAQAEGLDGDALEEVLDTDKLLAEVDSLKKSTKSA